MWPDPQHCLLWFISLTVSSYTLLPNNHESKCGVYFVHPSKQFHRNQCTYTSNDTTLKQNIIIWNLVSPAPVCPSISFKHGGKAPSDHRGSYTRGDKSLKMCHVGHFQNCCVYCSCILLTQARFIEKAATWCDCSYVLRALLGGVMCKSYLG